MDNREIKDLAVVLKSVDCGEADRMVTLLTSSNGKITAKMRGVKKAKAKLAYASFPLNLGEYILVKRGRNYTVINCSFVDNFSSLSADLNLFYAASGILEAAGHLAREGSNSYELFLLVIKNLKILAYNKNANIIKVLSKFLVDILDIAGFKIGADNVEKNKNLTYFDFQMGHLIAERKDECIELEGCAGECLCNLVNCSADEIDYECLSSKTILKLLVLFFEDKVDEELTIIKKFI